MKEEGEKGMSVFELDFSRCKNGQEGERTRRSTGGDPTRAKDGRAREQLLLLLLVVLPAHQERRREAPSVEEDSAEAREDETHPLTSSE